MLRRGVLIAGLLLVLASVATMASAQPGGFGFGFGGMMGGGASITSLLGIPTVQTELKLTDEQKEKAQDLVQSRRDKVMEAVNAGGGPPDFSSMSQEEIQKQMAETRKKVQAVDKELDDQAVKILNADQLARAKELQLQREGATALTREEVAKKLALTDDQVAKLKKLQDSLSQPPQFDPNGDFQAQMQKMRENQTKAQNDMLAVLTSDQKAAFDKMKGKEFTFPARRGFGRGGFGGGPGGPGGPGGGGN